METLRSLAAAAAAAAADSMVQVVEAATPHLLQTAVLSLPPRQPRCLPGAKALMCPPPGQPQRPPQRSRKLRLPVRIPMTFPMPQPWILLAELYPHTLRVSSWLLPLLGGYRAFWVQFVFLSLVGKRFTDRIRRPWKIWFFDTSKQGISAVLVHFLNILLSMAFGRWLKVKADPCNWYWINLSLDDTLGIGVQLILLRTLQYVYRSRCVGRPELALTGEYGDPPRCSRWARQLLDWQCLVLLQKVMLCILVVKWTSHVTVVAQFLLGWLDPFPRAKLVVVMVITPLTLNVFALWMADSFLQGDPGSARHEQIEGLVCGSPPHTIGSRDVDPLSAEEEHVVSFQEWKSRDSRVRNQRMRFGT
mmetsp:Transcript_75103/g.243024  ORF Transcript_75103/g.243024 Transcript_75103/m.243024 type:complete len:361 (-) Transcript_75103:46-1128(-)